jgi:hypothetical protein
MNDLNVLVETKTDSLQRDMNSDRRGLQIQSLYVREVQHDSGN